MFFLGMLSFQCEIRRDRPTETRRSTGRSRLTCWPPLVYGMQIHFFKKHSIWHELYRKKILLCNWQLRL